MAPIFMTLASRMATLVTPGGRKIAPPGMHNPQIGDWDGNGIGDCNGNRHSNGNSYWDGNGACYGNWDGHCHGAACLLLPQ